MPEKTSSGLVQVSIALITVLGSLGVAYITTGAKFKSEVDQAALKITALSKDVEGTREVAQGVQAKLSTTQGEVDKRIAELQQQLSATETKNAELQQLLAALKSDVETSKQKVNDTANDAIRRIDSARTRMLSERPTVSP